MGGAARNDPTALSRPGSGKPVDPRARPDPEDRVDAGRSRRLIPAGHRRGAGSARIAYGLWRRRIAEARMSGASGLGGLGGLNDEARIARATLLRVSEAATSLVHHVRAHGVEATLADIRAGALIPGVDVAALKTRLAEADGARDLEQAAAVDARLVCPGDAEWPALLDDLARIDADCFGLWVRGPERLDDVAARSVAIVGTRTPTAYGEHVAGELAAGLADRGWTVVSGLAYGIDGTAHRAALAAGGTTVGVLACGIDVVYPLGHRSLVSRVADE